MPRFDPLNLSPLDLGTWGELQRVAGTMPGLIEKGWLDDHLTEIIQAAMCRNLAVQSATTKKQRPRPQKKATS